MIQISKFFSVFLLLSALLFGNAAAQVVKNNPNQKTEQKSDEFLGLKLRPEVRAIVKEIEQKSGRKVFRQFTEMKEFMFGASYVAEDGSPVVLADYGLKDDPKKLETVVAHELLHLRLRVSGYPTFQFSESVNTAKGRAIDTEQDTLNDVTSLIEHQIFKADMERFGLYKYVDLAGDTAAVAKKNKSRDEGQSDGINYARAILEYQNAADIAEVRKIYTANKWTRALRDGEAIAVFIKTANIRAPKDVDTIFLKCLSQLFPLPGSVYNYKLTLAPNKKVERLMIVSIARRKAAARKSPSKRN